MPLRKAMPRLQVLRAAKTARPEYGGMDAYLFHFNMSGMVCSLQIDFWAFFRLNK
jgi:hypothetical protein